MRVALQITGIDQLLANMRLLNQQTSAHIAPKAINAATSIVTQRIRALTPVQRGSALKLPKNAKRPRLRNSIIYEYRGYPKASEIKTTHIGIAGAPARLQPHQWLVEDGTVQRFTNQKRVRVSRRQVGAITRNRLHRSRNGTVTVRQYQKKVWSSVYETRKKRQNAPQLNRGRMPAFHMFREGSAQASAQASAVLASTLRSELAKVRYSE